MATGKTGRRALRICMVAENYLPVPGGIAEHIYHLSAQLRKRGHRVMVLTSAYDHASHGLSDSRPDDEPFVRRVGRGLPIVANRSTARITIGYRVGKQVREFLEEERFDIVHIHGSLAPTLPLAALKHSRSINVGTFHAGHEKSTGYQVFQGYLEGYFRRLHGLIAVSETARRSMAEYFPGDYRIVPNGIDTDLFHPGAAPLPEFINGRPKILFLGRFDARKGLSYLLKALPFVKKQVPDFECIVVGSGPYGVEKYRSEVDSSVADAVEFTGSVESRVRPQYYASCDVFCAPSTGNESFGIILLEAMATGKPVVASDIDGYRDVLRDGLEGLFAPPEVPEAIAERLIRILKNPELARAMGRAGRNKALIYAWPRVTDQVEAYYGELVAQHGERLPDY